MKRYLETLFRHKLLFLTPLIIVPLVTVIVTVLAGRQSEVSAVIWIEPSNVLFTISEENPTPNELEALAMTERMTTEAFRTELLDRSGLEARIEAGEWPNPSRLESVLNGNGLLRPLATVLGQKTPDSSGAAKDAGLSMIQNSVTITTEGNNLLLVTYRGSEPDLGKTLVEETISLYNETVLEVSKEETNAGVDFLTRLLLTQQDRLDVASDDFQTFLEENPAPFFGQTRPANEEAELPSLQQDYNLEVALYQAALQRVEDLRLTGEASRTARDLTFQIIDPADIPQSAGVGLRTIGMMAFAGFTLGLILGVVPVVLITWRDSKIRTRDDVERAIETPSIIELPLLPTNGGGDDMTPSKAAIRSV